MQLISKYAYGFYANCLQTGINISCNLFRKETICMKRQINVEKIVFGNKEHITD